MKSYKEFFEQSDGHVWLNAASEGPLPIPAREALYKVIEKKACPHELTFEYFAKVPAQLKKSIGTLINVNFRDVILANSASYGIHILANGIVWQKGDEIVLMQNDFPTDILPWLALEEQGVVVKQIKPAGHMLTVEELKATISDKTRVVCLSQVHTFSGHRLSDVRAVSDLCHSKGAAFVLNISQSCGNEPIDVEAFGVDAIVCAGYKWLLGPYGIGFCWIDPDLRKTLKLNQSYWVSAMSDEDLKSEEALEYRDSQSARKYDMFGTANFFNTVPFTASIDWLMDIGIDTVKAHNDELTDRLINGLDLTKYQWISPTDPQKRSALAVISAVDPARNEAIHQSLAGQGLHTALWKNNIRITPHIYNTPEDMDLLLSQLNGQ